MFTGFGLTAPAGSGLGPGDQAIEVVAIGAIGAESFLVEKPFDSAAQADLIGITLRAHGPAQFAVPAAPEEHHAGAGQPRSQKA